MHMYLLLTTLLHSAAALPSCTSLYGFPQYESCEQLIHGDDMSSGYTGISNTDRRDHFFALPLASRPSYITDEQWNNKVNLPIIRSNPQVLCKLALIPLLSSTGIISTDTSFYSTLGYIADAIQYGCVSSLNAHPSGGHSLAGDNGRLLIILYARNSDFDRKIRRKLVLGEPIMGLQSERGNILPGLGNLDDDDDAVSSNKPPALNDDGGNINSAPSSPTCGQYCSGPSRLCDAAGGCLCIADPWQGVGSAYFTGRCKAPYRSTDSLSSGASGRELLGTVAAAGGTLILTNATVSAGGSDSIIEGGLAADAACPCNCTYVSRACCDSATGIVHELPALKLGALKPPNSSFVCDDATGRFRPMR